MFFLKILIWLIHDQTHNQHVQPSFLHQLTIVFPLPFVHNWQWASV